MKETERDTNKWGNISCSWMRRINIVKMFTTPEPWKVSKQSSKNSNGILQRNTKNNPNIYKEPQKTLNSQSNTEKEE